MAKFTLTLAGLNDIPHGDFIIRKHIKERLDMIVFV